MKSPRPAVSTLREGMVLANDGLDLFSRNRSRVSSMTPRRRIVPSSDNRRGQATCRSSWENRERDEDQQNEGGRASA